MVLVGQTLSFQQWCCEVLGVWRKRGSLEHSSPRCQKVNALGAAGQDWCMQRRASSTPDVPPDLGITQPLSPEGLLHLRSGAGMQGTDLPPRRPHRAGPLFLHPSCPGNPSLSKGHSIYLKPTSSVSKTREVAVKREHPQAIL